MYLLSISEDLMESKNYLGVIADCNNQGGDDDDPIVPPGEPHLINKDDSISIMTKIFTLTTTY